MLRGPGVPYLIRGNLELMDKRRGPTSESKEIGDAGPEEGSPEPSMPESENASEFDFDAHRQQALDAYQGVRQQYQDCAEAAESVLKAALEAANIQVHTLESRAKDPESFARKASLPSEQDPGQPKYPNPLRQITDLAAVRVITFLLDDVEKVNAQVEEQFHVLEKVNKSGLLVKDEKLGYHSVHYLVGFTAQRLSMPEYARHRALIIEIQVRTILQHAWAEIEHDIQYKAIETPPPRSGGGLWRSLGSWRSPTASSRLFLTRTRGFATRRSVTSSSATWPQSRSPRNHSRPTSIASSAPMGA
jgi:ppGpp synthetase/RelA/SpoT-type nucleotidyltranferase